ncbi:MAG: glutamate ligase domain-containing protein, partial [Novipirellula sp. JB048]
ANHAAAAAVGVLLNEPLAEVVEHLGRLREVPGRMQWLPSWDAADVILDAAGSPERIGAALRSARALRQPGGRLWCVMSIDPEAAPLQLALAGNHLERFADQSIVTCDADSKTHFLQASHALLDGVEDCALVRLVADDRRAIQWAIASASPRDTILWVGATERRGAEQERGRIQEIAGWVTSAQASRQEEANPSRPPLHVVTAADAAPEHDHPMILPMYKP